MGSIRDVVTTLIRADGASTAFVYQELGLQLSYAPERRSVPAEATPNMGILSWPRGDLNQIPLWPVLRQEVVLGAGGDLRCS